MSYPGLLVRGWSPGYGEDRSGSAYYEFEEKLRRPAPIQDGVPGQRHGPAEGLTLEGCDPFQEEGEVGSPIHWAIRGDFQGCLGRV